MLKQLAVEGFAALMGMVRRANAAKLSPMKALQTGRLGMVLPPLFLGQHKNPAANARRKAKAEIGARQHRKNRKALARVARAKRIDDLDQFKGQIRAGLASGFPEGNS